MGSTNIRLRVSSAQRRLRSNGAIAFLLNENVAAANNSTLGSHRGLGLTNFRMIVATATQISATDQKQKYTFSSSVTWFEGNDHASFAVLIAALNKIADSRTSKNAVKSVS
jgi:hypothetical protein